MKQERKIALLHSFPLLPAEFKMQMEGKGARNFCVFLTNGHELFVRCYHRYSSGEVFERQRYVFAKDGSVRYICTVDGKSKTAVNWHPSKMREPVFYLANSNWCRYVDNSYNTINLDAYKNSDMRYCPLKMSEGLLIEFLHLYAQHPNMEYLYKSGYGCLIQKTFSYYYGTSCHLKASDKINWKSNNLLKMLGLNRAEFKLLQGNEQHYESYIRWRKEYPKERAENILQIARMFNSEFGTADLVISRTGYSLKRISRYLAEQNLELHLYTDYLRQCEKLKYDTHDTAICFPRDFHKMHTRLSEILTALQEHRQRQIDKEKERQIAIQVAKAKKYRQRMEFSYNGLILRQPMSAEEIIEEGKVLHHCVGGYVDRHLRAQTNIFFIRKVSDPDTPYFTIEVSNDFRIIQCHGYKNNDDLKTKEINVFEEKYKNYLEGLKEHERNNNNRILLPCC